MSDKVSSMIPHDGDITNAKYRPSTGDALLPKQTIPRHSVQERHARAALHQLPMELLEMIFESLSPPPTPPDTMTLAMLARTCKRLSHVIRPILFRNAGGRELSRWDVYLLLRSLEENPSLQTLVQSLSFVDDSRCQDPCHDLEMASSFGSCQDQFFRRLIGRYIGKFPGGTSRVGLVHTREYTLLLTLFLHLTQTTLSRAHIKIPDCFWTSENCSITRKLESYVNKGFIQRVYNGMAVTKLPTLIHLTHLTLDCQNVGPKENQDALLMMLEASPNLKTLNLQQCRIHDHTQTVQALGSACPSLVTFTLSGMPGSYELADCEIMPFPTIMIMVIIRQLWKNVPTLEKIHIGGWQIMSYYPPAWPSSTPGYLPISFAQFFKTKVISIHCWTMYRHGPDNGDVLVNMVKGCSTLEHLELVGVETRYLEKLNKELTTFRGFVGKGESWFPHLRRISLVYCDSSMVRTLVSPSLFVSTDVDLVFTNEKGWWDGGLARG